MPEADLKTPLLVRLALGLERRLAGLKHRRMTLAESGRRHTVHYLERHPAKGTEKVETLLLVHGFGGDKDNWTRFVRHLGGGLLGGLGGLGGLRQRYRIVALDLPGFGESSRLPDAPYDVETQVERLRTFADQLDLGPLHLAGNSMGGAIVGQFAARFPERVGTVCLLEPLAMHGAEAAEIDGLLEGRQNPLVPRDVESFDALLDFVFEERPFLPGPIRRFLARRAAHFRDHLERVWKEIWHDHREPLKGHLEAIEAPVLLLWGDTNRVFHTSVIEAMEPHLSESSVQILEGCGHVPMVERPRAVARRYRLWRKRHRASAPAISEA